jgi:hypothetical protein
MQLESDPAAAIRGMRKVLATKDCENFILQHMAEKVLSVMAPDAVDIAAAHRLAALKNEVRQQLRRELEVEALKRCGAPNSRDAARTGDELDAYERVLDAIERICLGLPGRRRFDRTVNAGNVVAFAFGGSRPDGDGSHLPPGVA